MLCSRALRVCLCGSCTAGLHASLVLPMLKGTCTGNAPGATCHCAAALKRRKATQALSWSSLAAEGEAWASAAKNRQGAGQQEARQAWPGTVQD